MPTGVIKIFSVPKGYGFIAIEGGKDIFLPLATVTEARITDLKLGQHVSFEIKPDKKGPKAINLALIENPPTQQASNVAEVTRGQDNSIHLSYYYDPDNEEHVKSLAALHATGRDYTLVNIIENPPSRDTLISLSLLLREYDQSLVRKYDPLFLDLRLDDRFISQNEVWDAVVEHPSLINGPILATPSGARICGSVEDIEAFLEGRPPITNGLKRRAR